MINSRTLKYYHDYSRVVIILAAMTMLHRVIILVLDIWKNFSQVYFDPGYEFETILTWWEQYRSAILVGISNDLVFILVASLIALFFKLRFTFPILLILGLFYAANIEHILYNFSHIKLDMIHYALDPTFVKGSGTTISFFVSFGIMVLVAILAAVLTHFKWVKFIVSPVAVIMLCAVFILPNDVDPLNPGWMQTHPLGARLQAATLSVDQREFSDKAFEPTLPPTNYPKGQQLNVLVVYLEGISQHSIAKGDMPFLESLASENFAFTRYFGNQTQTSNGLFTTLTGHLPNFLRKGSPWNNLAANDPVARAALPAVLAKQGYNTAFLQSAALRFMNKDKHLSHLGFDVIKGRSDWDQFYTANGWGIDDLSLFENGLNYIDGLDPDVPWFVSFLTSGTHAPYNVPKEFMPHESTRLRALKYADAAAKGLMTGLQARGLLENTVVVFTADESREPGGKSNLENEILLNWLPFVVVHPNAVSGTMSSPISSAEFRNLVLTFSGDWTVQDIEALNRPEVPLIFGNYYNSRVFWFDKQKESFFACYTQDFLCARFDGVKDVVQLDGRTPSALVQASQMQAVFEEHEPAK